MDTKFIEWDGRGTEVAFVISKNLTRRHLDTSQRAMVAAKLTTFSHGGDRSKGPNGTLKIAEAAQQLNVGERSVKRARQVIDDADPALREAVEQGEVSVGHAAAMVRRAAPVAGPKTIMKKPTTKGGKRQKQYAALWRRLRDALEALNGLPDPAMMANTVPPACSIWFHDGCLSWRIGFGRSTKPCKTEKSR